MIYYHIQEKRRIRLIEPLLCNKNNVWIGGSYYLGGNEDDDDFWEKQKCERNLHYKEINDFFRKEIWLLNKRFENVSSP